MMAATPHFLSIQGNFENLIEQMPLIIKGAMEFCKQAYSDFPVTEGFQFLLCGYSQMQEKVVCYHVEREPNSERIETSEIQRALFAPNLEGMPYQLATNIEGMCELAKFQSEHTRDQIAAGGKYFIVKVKRNNISVSKAFDFSVL